MERPTATPPSLTQLAGFFLKLGTFAFGGPAAHIAMMEDEVVRRRRWVSSDDFMDFVALSNLLPGPGSTEVAILIGYRIGGISGLLLAGICFILPAFLMVTALAWGYVRYGGLPVAAGLLYGVKPVVIAIVLQALWRLQHAAVKTRLLGGIGVLALVASFAGAPPSLVLAGATALTFMIYAIKQPQSVVLPTHRCLVPLLPMVATAPATAGVSGIFLLFLKVGCIVFGSGYVLLAFLRADLVVHRHWLTEAQLLDSVAVGQVTPGPVFTTATFIGYVLGGPPGAVVATAGIFAPAFAFVAIAGPLVRKIRASMMLGKLLDTINVASLALMAYVTCELARNAIVDGTTLALAVTGAVVLFTFKINSTWLVAAGASAGLFITVLKTR